MPSTGRWQAGFDEQADFAAEESERPLLPRRRALDKLDLDLAPMIDVTFLLLIFFLVSSVPDVQEALRLPPAQYGVSVGTQSAVIVSLASRPGLRPAVYLADGKVGAALTDDLAQQEHLVREAILAGVQQGKLDLIIKAERDVPHREVARLAALAADLGSLRINLAVSETE